MAGTPPPQTSPQRHRDAHSAAEAFSVLSADVRSHGGQSGYSAGPEAVDVYERRLQRFYQFYNPQKLSRVREFLEGYRGCEEDLFTTLRTKYGPEPPMPRAESVGSDVPGASFQLPTQVSPAEGYTEQATPFWPGSRVVCDTDLCELLASGSTSNEALRRCYLGALSEHPGRAHNGMVYSTTSPMPSMASRFLGHVWAGKLGNHKVLVHRGVEYHRSMMHCTMECSGPEFPHVRWRLTAYRTAGKAAAVYRVMYDPVFDDAAFDEASSQHSDASPLPPPAPRRHSARERHESRGSSMSSAPISARQPQQPPQPAQPAQPPQPAQAPQAIATAAQVAGLMDALQCMEARLMARLDMLDERLKTVEDSIGPAHPSL